MSPSAQPSTGDASADVTPGDGPLRGRVFVSYSRKDMVFADSLEAALRAQGFEPRLNRTEIYAFEDWWQRIQALIGRADAVVFALSPDAVDSDICRREVEFAMSLNKRLAPVVWRRVDDRLVPEALRRLNFIFFDDEARFDASVNLLAEALSTDIDWVRKHTEFGEQARRWHVAGRPGPRGLLLRSPVLEQAEGWIAARPSGPSQPLRPRVARKSQFLSEQRIQGSRRRTIRPTRAKRVSGSLAPRGRVLNRNRPRRPLLGNPPIMSGCSKSDGERRSDK
jgi:hypothetical protein